MIWRWKKFKMGSPFKNKSYIMFLGGRKMEKIIEELFEKRADTMMKRPNKYLDEKMSELKITEKEDEIIGIFKKITDEETSIKLQDLFFYYCNAKEKETNLYNEYYYKLGFADSLKLKQEIEEID